MISMSRKYRIKRRVINNVKKKIDQKLIKDVKNELSIDRKSFNRDYSEHIGLMAKALVSQKFNPHYNPRSPYDRSWDDIRTPESSTLRIAKQWKHHYTVNRYKYPTRNNPAASYPGLLT